MRKTSEAYQRSIVLNDMVATHILRYQRNRNRYSLEKIFFLLEPITSQQINSVLAKLRLSSSHYEDMLQDSFIKLTWAIESFDYARCPVFTGFWRRVVSNYLLDTYYKRWRAQAELTENNTKPVKSDIVDKIILNELVSSFFEEYRGNELVLEILKTRIFIQSDHAARQKSIAEKFGKTQGYVSRWEAYLYSRIAEEE